MYREPYRQFLTIHASNRRLSNEGGEQEDGKKQHVVTGTGTMTRNVETVLCISKRSEGGGRPREVAHVYSGFVPRNVSTSNV